MEMVVVILFIFSFNLLFLNGCNSSNWYQKLPDEKFENGENLIGLNFFRNNTLRSPLNSTIFFHLVDEEISFLKENQFEKKVTEKIKNEDGTQLNWKVGYGNYSQNGNWFLMEIYKIKEKTEKKTGLNEGEKEIHLKILYYFWKKEKLLIPMVYENGFMIYDYGVKDLVKTPFDFKDKTFEKALIEYSKKEFKTHAYKLSK
jgi:hypothetical protein